VQRVAQAYDTGHEPVVGGAFNFRDVGGPRAGSGAVVGRGLLYRSGDLGRLTEAGAEQLRALGVATVVDLRTAGEVERRGRHPFERLGIAYRHLPLLDSRTVEPEALPTDLPPDILLQVSRRIAGEGAPNVGTVLTWLGQEVELPAVVHCVAGKDRTGLVVGVVLSLLGVSDDDVAADYARSEPALQAMRRWAAGNDADLAAWLARIPPQMLEAKPATMLQLLNWLRGEHGSIDQFAHSIGAGPDTVGALRSRLLVTS
jgi:protein-tyrosine phosphatase